MLAKADLDELSTKYTCMLRLRDLHARARSEPGFVEPDPRAAMLELSARWPGALRELDMLPREVIVTRLDALEAARLDAARLERWMVVSTRFHRLARGALAVKRWLGRRREIDDATRARFVDDLAHAQHGADAYLWAGALEQIARPPGGRLMDVVFARLRDELGESEHDVKRWLFGSPTTRTCVGASGAGPRAPGSADDVRSPADAEPKSLR